MVARLLALHRECWHASLKLLPVAVLYGSPHRKGAESGWPACSLPQSKRCLEIGLSCSMCRSASVIYQHFWRNEQCKNTAPPLIGSKDAFSAAAAKS